MSGSVYTDPIRDKNFAFSNTFSRSKSQDNLKEQGPICPKFKPTNLIQQCNKNKMASPKPLDPISNLIEKEYHKYCITEQDVNV